MTIGTIIAIAIATVACLPLILMLTYLALRSLWFVLQWVGFAVGCCWIAWGVLFGLETIDDAKEDIPDLLPVW